MIQFRKLNVICFNPFTFNDVVKAREEDDEDPALGNEAEINDLEVDGDEPILGTEEFVEERGQCMLLGKSTHYHLL